ncbi:hypothetical protein ACFV4P_11875 [Kitasatospora sp. NPDC059795]|uniref:hypothetical protein n=1 Tax=Kitasatospora sp. NPDC059795 TaxID=3346949 RepID=UPI0036685FD7
MTDAPGGADRSGRSADPSDPSAARNVPALLLTLRRAEFTGSIVVASTPGGTIHLERGLITAIETPGAPAVGTLLLRSGRIAEADWTAAVADLPSGAHGDLGAVLVARGAIGAAELETVCASALFDAAFALVLSRPGGWQVAEADAPARIALRPGIEPRRLFEETARRVSLLTRLGSPPGALARVRIRPAAQAGAATAGIPARYRELLVAATGRRTARDLGFALGRGVFAVMLDLVRMDARHLLHREPAPAAPGGPAIGLRTPPAGPPPGVTGPLPRRIPGRRAPVAADGTPERRAERTWPSVQAAPPVPTEST